MLIQYFTIDICRSITYNAWCTTYSYYETTPV